MGKQKKATKKFEKNKLKGTLERRKDFAKTKQRHKQKEKRARNADQSQQSHDEDGSDLSASEVENMDRDDFFQETIPVPDVNVSTSSKKRKRNADSEIKEKAAQLASSDDDGGEDDDDDDHREQLEALAEKDPEFYKYLQENDADLLDFENELGEGLSDVSDDESNGRPNKKQKTAQPEITEVTEDMVRKWAHSVEEQHSMRALRQLIIAFKTAAQSDEDEKRAVRFSIPSSDVYHHILVTALRVVPKALAHYLPVKESVSGKLRIATNDPKFKTLSPLIKTHATSLHSLLGNLSDSGTMRLTLQSFEPLLPYLLQFRKFLKIIIKSISSIWADTASDEATRVSAFIILRRVMTIGDAGIREMVLKSTYEGIVRGARNVTEITLPSINLMKNSAVELWGIDQKLSYTTAFTSIRQLAVHLRGHITKPTKDSYKQIYNWQFIHSLDFWSRVLSSHCNSLLEAQTGKASQLRPLIYPVTQITLGVMRLIPTATYFPLRFQLIRSLLRISQTTGTYIPLSAALLEVLNSPEMKKSAKPSTLRPLDFASNIRAPASYSKTRVYQDGLGEQVVELFCEFFVLWCKSIAYPELQLPVTVMLKRWLKTASQLSTGNKNGKLNQSLLLLVQKSETNSKWIEERRNKVNFAPKDRTEVESFLKDTLWEDTPLGAFVVTQRKQRDERRKVVEKGREEERRRKKASKVDDDFGAE